MKLQFAGLHGKRLTPPCYKLVAALSLALIVSLWLYSPAVPDHVMEVAKWSALMPAIIAFLSVIHSAAGAPASSRRVNAGEAMDKSDEKYRTLIKQASDAIFISNNDGNILESNGSAWKLSGFDSHELASMTVSQLYLQEELRQRPLQYRELFEKKIVRSERTIVRKDGALVPVEATVRQLSDGRFMAILRDISERKMAEDQLRAAVEKYELLAQATSDTTWDWDIIRNTKTYNAGIREVFGYDVHEVQDALQWINDKIHPEDLANVKESFQHVIDNMAKNLQLEYRVKCADGTYKYVYDRSFVIYGADHRPARLIGAMQDITKSKNEEKRMANAIMEAQEQERLHLAQELHDNVNQILACAHLTLDAACHPEDDIASAHELIAHARNNIELAIAEIRKLSHHLAPAAIEDACLKDIIQELLHRINIGQKYNIEFVFDNDLADVDDERMVINLYRMTQEQLKNIVTHADAQHICVTLSVHEKHVQLKIQDDGRGFDPRTSRKGIGLTNMRKRAESLFGKFTLISAPGKGCTIVAELPMENQRPS